MNSIFNISETHRIIPMQPITISDLHDQMITEMNMINRFIDGYKFEEETQQRKYRQHFKSIWIGHMGAYCLFVFWLWLR